MKKILISLPYSMSVRNYLRNNSFKNHCSDQEFVIASHLTKDAEFLKEFNEIYTHMGYPKIPLLIKVFLRILINIESSVWLDNVYISSFEIIRKSIRLGYADKLLMVNSGIFSLFTHFLKRNKIISNALRKIIKSSAIKIFENYDLSSFDRVFLTHPYTYEERLLSFALPESVDVIASIHSWDNITTKPCMLQKYNKVLVWNSIMKNQMIKLYNYKSSDIFVVGMPQSDFYFNADKSVLKKFIYSYLNIHPDKKIITYACACPEFVPSQEVIVNDVINSMLNLNLFNKNYVLVIREHPGRTLPEILKLIDGKNIILDRPSIAFDPNIHNVGWDSSQSDQFAFYSLLLNSDILINCFSTTTIDAAITNTPIINIGYDYTKYLNYYASVIKHYDWEHYTDIVKSKGVDIAKNSSELNLYIQSALENPNFKINERRKIVNDQIEFSDGNSMFRIMEILKG